MACGGEGLWEGLRLDGGLEVGCDGVFPEGEVEGGGMRCQPAGSPPCASFSALKGALWDWSANDSVSSKSSMITAELLCVPAA